MNPSPLICSKCDQDVFNFDHVNDRFTFICVYCGSKEWKGEVMRDSREDVVMRLGDTGQIGLI